MKTILNRFVLGFWLLLAAASAPAMASQGSCVLPTTGTVSGLTLVQDINTCIQAIMTNYSGATAPVNGAGGVSLTYQFWLKTTDKTLNVYDGANWLPTGTIDSSGSIWQPPIGGGSQTVASATTTDLCSVAASTLTISGTTTITSFSNSCVTGTSKVIRFSGALVLTHNATSLILPNNSNNITTVAGDRAFATYLGGGNWEIWIYQRANGTALNASAIFTAAVAFSSPVTVTLASNTNDWAPSGLSSANVLRLTCSSSINVTGLTASATDGTTIVIDNVGATNNCTFTSQDAASSAANRFAFDRPIALRPGRSLVVKYDLTATRWRLLQEITAQPVAGGFKNLQITNDPTNGTTLNSNLIGTADEVIVEDTNGGAARLSTFSCSAALTTSGAGGLDAGSAAVGTWYSYWAIFNPTTNAASCLFSISATAPTMPSGYTFKARLGWGRTQAATNAYFFRTIQQGRNAQYVVTTGTNTAAYIAAATGSTGNVNTPTWTSVSLSTITPSTAARVRGIVYSGNGVNAVTIAAPNNAAGGTTTTTNPPPAIAFSTSGSFGTASSFDFAIETANTMYWASNGANNSLFVMGWEDNI